jgi:hypothetical protein
MIYTSYFASRKYDITKAVSIAKKSICGFDIPIYSDLAPSYDILEEYKERPDQQRYILRYTLEILSRLDPQKVSQDLDEKVLLCYEKTGDFCHRHIAAKWLNIYTNITVIEI